MTGEADVWCSVELAAAWGRARNVNRLEKPHVIGWSMAHCNLRTSYRNPFTDIADTIFNTFPGFQTRRPLVKYHSTQVQKLRGM